MDLNFEEYYDNLDRIFSAAAPIYDQKIQANFINVGIREKEVESVVKHYRGGWKVLEIGCGTGEEAKKVMEATRCKLTCIDVSKGMLDYALSKIEKSGLGSNFRATRIPASSIGSIEGKFGIIYSFNGALNNEPQLTKFFKSLEDLVESGGYFIVSVRNRLSFGEAIVDLVRFRFGDMFERINGEMIVEVVGRAVRSHYFYNKEFLDLVPSSFKLEQMRGLGIFAIPSFQEKIKPEGAISLLKRLETAFTDFPLFNRFGDETLFVFQKI